jgi:hypothetical protein
MELGLRALVAAGAESVMTLHACRQVAFRPRRGAGGGLSNEKEFEQFLSGVHAEGESFHAAGRACMLHDGYVQLY